MKILLLIFFTTLFNICNGQQKGDTVLIGKGSKADQGYAYITTEPVKIGRSYSLPVPLTPGWEGYTMIVVDEKTLNGRRYLVLSLDKKKKAIRYLCDPLLAVKYGEILPD